MPKPTCTAQPRPPFSVPRPVDPSLTSLPAGVIDRLTAHHGALGFLSAQALQLAGEMKGEPANRSAAAVLAVLATTFNTARADLGQLLANLGALPAEADVLDAVGRPAPSGHGADR